MVARRVMVIGNDCLGRVQHSPIACLPFTHPTASRPLTRLLPQAAFTARHVAFAAASTHCFLTTNRPNDF